MELWGGVTPTFWDAAALGPGQTLEWQERWYPVSGLHGAFNYADDAAAVRAADLGNQVLVAIAPTQAVAGRVVLWWNGAKAADWPVSMWPGRPFQKTWTKSEAAGGEIGVTVLDRYGKVVSRYGKAGPPTP